MSQPDVNSVFRPRAPGEVDALAQNGGAPSVIRAIESNLHSRRQTENGYGGFLTEEEALFLLDQLRKAGAF